MPNHVIRLLEQARRYKVMFYKDYTFTVHIRLNMLEHQTDKSQPSRPNGATVFVVDDDISMLRSLTRLLRSAGWNVETFASASEFLDRNSVTGPGCILLDVKMPGMNGLELHECLSDAGISLPVVFLSGNSDIPMSVRAMKHGAIDFLVKPVEEDALLQALSRAIKRFDEEQLARQYRDRFKSRLALLTERERQVMEQVLLGYLNKQIAVSLGISEKTVKVHRSRVMEKMEAGSIAELVHMCDSAGIEFHQDSA
jgi:FixJ family two-component response regulator